MEFPRHEYWNELPFPSLGDLPNPGIEPGSFTLQAVSLPSEPPGKPWDPMHHLLWQPIGKSCGFCFWLKSARCKCLLLASKNLSHLILIFTKEKTNQKNLTDIYLLKAHFFFFLNMSCCRDVFSCQQSCFWVQFSNLLENHSRLIVAYVPFCSGASNEGGNRLYHVNLGFVYGAET